MTTRPTITFTEDELNPYATHGSTHHRPTGPGLPPGLPGLPLGLPGLPGDGGRLTFGAPHTDRLRTQGLRVQGLRAQGLRTVADTTVHSEGRSTVLPDWARGDGARLDGARGEIPTTYFLHDHPDLTNARPLAPSLEKLVRFATAVDELAALRGQFASYAGRLGPKAVAEATRRLLAVFEAGATGTERAQGASDGSRGRDGSGESGLFRKLAAVIRPLALAAGPCTASGLALDLPARLLDEEFGSGEVVRFDAVDFPRALTHVPTRRFLRERGLPESAVRFSLETDMPLQTLAEYRAEGRGGALTGQWFPAGADRLIRLGSLSADTGLVLDGATGAVLVWSEPDGGLRPLNADISTLAFTFWLIRRESGLEAVHALTEAYGRLADSMCRTLAAVEPTDCPRVFDDGTGAELYS
ncbi:SUKH-4 family immunity protein [Streptomyces humidus]|uniref:SUKH-4 family immunity protein n=1 Tax=Streptomyces humidus TaxID=52259 RepID=UPI0033302665